MNNLIPISYNCPSCGESNETFVDPTGGAQQRYTEDCAICCRPTVLQIILSEDGNVRLDAEFEG